MTVTVYDFTTSDWELLSTPDERIIVFNPSGIPVSICYTLEETLPEDMSGIAIFEIGGMYNEYTGPENGYVWAKSTESAFVRIRPFGTVDPETDTHQLGQAINNLGVKVNDHMNDTSNPHVVTKDQVELGNIPNAITSDPNEDSEDILATAAAVNAAYKEFGDHAANKDNPHEVTKAQVKLGKVQNWAPATLEQAVDASEKFAYMTPETTAVAIAQLAEVAYSTPPQIIVAGKIANRPVGWNYTECGAPTELVTKIEDKKVVINAGLQVSFASDHKSRLSTPLETPIELNLPPEYYSRVYIYVNLKRNGVIESAGATNIRPQSGECRDSTMSDFFSTSTCQMYDQDNKPIHRVYIAKVYLKDKAITGIVSVPIGTDHVLPVPIDMKQNTRFLLANPFIDSVDVVATEVFYNETWGSTEWNDQIGVIGNRYPSDPIDSLVVQTGLMGVLSCGQESGSPFGLTFPTVTSPIRTRLHLRKTYK